MTELEEASKYSVIEEEFQRREATYALIGDLALLPIRATKDNPCPTLAV